MLVKSNKENPKNFHSKKNVMQLKIQLIKIIRVNNNLKMISNINIVLIDYLQQQKMNKNTINILKIGRLLEIIKIRNYHFKKIKYK